jgi:vanillate O-demethylase ferredoxin subunit
MSNLLVKVIRKKSEAEGIASFELAAPDGLRLPPFSAGAHIDVHVGDALVRQYSLCNDSTGQDHYRIAVLRDPASRGGSSGMHAFGEGDLLRISAPKNHFPLVSAPKVLLFAGGIGVTPLLCMAQELGRGAADFEMHYSGRSLTSMAFKEEIAASAYAGKVHFHADDGDVAQKLDLARVLAANPSCPPLYVCGPAGFMDFVINAARQANWPEQNIHREYFGAAPAAPAAGAERAFEVQLASSGQSFHIPPDQSVTAVLAAHGVEIPVSCEQGVCGTCITGVVEGVPDHRDLYFSDAEHARNDQFTPCCSRAKSAVIVLDL